MPEETAESRQQRHRRKRRLEGKCGREGCAKASGERYYCEDHARDNRNYKKHVNEAL